MAHNVPAVAGLLPKMVGFVKRTEKILISQVLQVSVGLKFCPVVKMSMSSSVERMALAVAESCLLLLCCFAMVVAVPIHPQNVSRVETVDSTSSVDVLDWEAVSVAWEKKFVAEKRTLLVMLDFAVDGGVEIRLCYRQNLYRRREFPLVPHLGHLHYRYCLLRDRVVARIP